MPTDIQPFDVHRMFFGEFPLLFLLEIVFRTLFMYYFAVIAARFIGKRGMNQLTAIEYILVIVLGSATGDPMFYPSVPLIHGVVVITSVVVSHRFLNILIKKSDYLKQKLESSPTLIISEGELDTKTLQQTTMSKDDVLMELRMQQIQDVGEIRRAYLEPSGKLSIFTYPQGEVKQTQSTLPTN